jgi:hypothetical protein
MAIGDEGERALADLWEVKCLKDFETVTVYVKELLDRGVCESFRAVDDIYQVWLHKSWPEIASTSGTIPGRAATAGGLAALLSNLGNEMETDKEDKIYRTVEDFEGEIAWHGFNAYMEHRTEGEATKWVEENILPLVDAPVDLRLTEEEVMANWEKNQAAIEGVPVEEFRRLRAEDQAAAEPIWPPGKKEAFFNSLADAFDEQVSDEQFEAENEDGQTKQEFVEQLRASGKKP